MKQRKKTARSRVGIAKVTGPSVADAVHQAMSRAQVLDALEPGADVCLKPNLGFDLFYPGAVTSPWVVEGVIRALSDRVGSITIVESDQVLVDIEKAFRRCGFQPLLRHPGVRFVNMSKGSFVDVPVPDHRRLSSIRMPEILLDRPLITIPVMKTHDKSTISGAIKNQWGCLDVFRHNYHLVLNEVLSDIHKILQPVFAVCDATVALEGDGPKTGRPRVVNRVLASTDIVALDAVCARIMGFDPEKIDHLQLLDEDGRGTARDYQVIGEDIEGLDLRFRSAGHNLVSQVELVFRHSAARRLVFETPVLDLMCSGANLWYQAWYHLGPGSRIRDQIIEETPYGAQWR
jgi:uncharacterized protein (DUF362 family)